MGTWIDRFGFGVQGRCLKVSESRFDDVRKIHTSGIGKEFKEEDMILYIDPSVTTNIIQVIAAVVIAGGAVISVIWRKAKKKVNKVLNIDENKGKEVEAGIESDDLD